MDNSITFGGKMETTNASSPCLMSVQEAVRQRRAIKGFDPNHRMSDEEFHRLMSAAILSPTAFNIQHWRFVHVADPSLRAEIRKTAWDQPQTTDASILLILCMDLQAWRKDPQRYWRNAPQEAQTFILNAMRQYYEGKAQTQRDEGMRSCGIVAMSLMLLAKEMGYDSCPMDGFDFDAVARLIRLPPDHAICMMLAIGKGVKDPWPKPGQLPLESILIENRF
jgi:nitroreductase